MLTQKLEWKAASKIGSLDYAKHKPGMFYGFMFNYD